MSRLVAAFALLVAVVFLAKDFHAAEACAPTNNNESHYTTGRKKRSLDEDVNVVLTTSRKFEQSTSGERMQSVEKQLKEFAELEGISFRRLQSLPRTSEDIGAQFAVLFTVEGEFDKCVRVMQFIQAATNEIKEILSATVKCGDFDVVHVSKKKNRNDAVTVLGKQ